MGKLDEWLSWPHEIFHIAAAYLVGVPRRAMTYTARCVYVPYRVGRWRHAVIALAPFAVFFSVSVVLIVLWWIAAQTADVPGLAERAATMAQSGEWKALPQHLSALVAWISVLGAGLHVIGFALIYLHTCLYDVFCGLPTTLRRYDELLPLTKPGVAGECELPGQQVMSLLRQQVGQQPDRSSARRADRQPNNR